LKSIEKKTSGNFVCGRRGMLKQAGGPRAIPLDAFRQIRALVSTGETLAWTVSHKPPVALGG